MIGDRDDQPSSRAGASAPPSAGGAAAAASAGAGAVGGAGRGSAGDDPGRVPPDPSDAGTAGAAASLDAAIVEPADAAVPAADGLVPVFLAMGYGTRRIVSCDFGLSWVNDEADVANGGDDGYLVRGLAAGQNVFVAAVGGGGTQKLFSSDDGVTFTRFDRGGNGFSDVSFGLGRFVAGGGHASVISFDGYAFEQPGAMGDGGILRHLAFGDYDGGRFVAVGDNGRRMNSRDGVSWGAQLEEGPGLQGVAYGNGAFVAISGGAETRYSLDGGAGWQAGNIDGAQGVRGILFDGARFIVTSGGDAFTSEDGRAWTRRAATSGPGRFDVSDDRLHYAGAQGGDLFHSSDGLQWTRVKQGGQALERVKFARVKPSPVCPAP
ncbi:MAG TPA: hypothetical protein VK509_11225 [Polyangiales bacterium]|nr:hypothetical protein [Polyangiales bacterium]